MTGGREKMKNNRLWSQLAGRLLLLLLALLLMFLLELGIVLPVHGIVGILILLFRVLLLALLMLVMFRIVHRGTPSACMIASIGQTFPNLTEDSSRSEAQDDWIFFTRSGSRDLA